MSNLRSLYPFGLALVNIAVGWVLYSVLDATLGALVASVGVVILLAVVHETSRPASDRLRPLPRLGSNTTADEEPPDHPR